MDAFGVRNPQLRAMARTPEIPLLRNMLSDPAAIVYEWLGGSRIRNLEGGEYSAWGISSAPADQALKLKVRREGRGGINLVIPKLPLVPKRP